MKENKEVAVNESELSNSKKKRLDREKKNSKKKAESLVLKIVGAVVVVAVVALIVWGIVSASMKKANTITASNDYSAQLEDNGFIKGVKAADYVDLCDYKNIEVPLSEVEYPDASVEADIQSALEEHQTLATEDVEVKDGDTINLDYVGSIDGVEFEGGTAEGSDLEIGSGTFIDDFEQQLIGYKPGEVAVVNVTFPEDYQSEELAGQDAEFVCTINGVYVNPEFDDDFVCAYYSDVATTADGYRQYLKDSNYDDSLTNYITTYLNDNSTVKKYPNKYLKNVESTTKYSDEESFEYMNQMYEQYYGSGFSSFEEYSGQTPEEYEASLVEDSQNTVKSNLIYQAILEKEGIALTEDDLIASLADSYGDDEAGMTNIIDTYGKGYMMLNLIEQKAVEIAKANATVK